MPFVDIVTKDDYASLWYWTNTYNNNVGIFDPARPVLVLLHPSGLDSSWMQPQVEDPRLHNNYNIIMFDTRVTGKSKCRYSGKHDLWVTAADLAQAFYHLRLPPAHIFAPDLYCFAAMRFAALFPDLCLSLILCNVPPPTEVRSVFATLEELNHMWGFAEDLESYEYACKEFLNVFCGPYAHSDLQDEIVAFWEVFCPPFRRAYSMANMNLVLNRTPMEQRELASITCPVFIIQAEKSAAHPFHFVEQLKQDLTGAPKVTVVRSHGCGAGYLSVVHASVVNKSLFSFLSAQPRPGSSEDRAANQRIYAIPHREFMAAGLRRLAHLKGDAEIKDRNPCSSLSFSCATDDIVRNQEEMMAKYVEGQQQSFSPLGPDGRPIRKFSERNSHWLEAGYDGFSRSEISNKKRLGEADKKKRPKPSRNDAEKEKKGQADGSTAVSGPSNPPLEETVTSEDQQLARMRRGNLSSGHVVEQRVLKGAASKLTGPSPGQALRSLIR
ncbi:hypothetical protein PHLGIDRAFT_34214 [Phlebiopsis gigantea 11061_1 CR5-6]|uniref:AB hydrolase-1 domain-containing protein n=1 Tax=Phlebiopsis gigantea (strain 11061_1 CR5-6) TaxID=745531 RepID=A0A0C3PRK2_PHLG1|nr:hypothetical protein PHLGIDRAFT_34214 [Phlebiopsis gigantea 11061_1 CR5-6]